MPRYEFNLTLTKDEVLRYYRGAAHTVTARMTDGRVIQFPANLLVRHVRHDGIIGRFALITDEHHRAIELQRVTTADR